MSVFNNLYAEHYDDFYKQKNYSSECDLIEQAASCFLSEKPKSLLDIGCGTGGHTIELASRGYQLTGIDLSQCMLDIAQAKAERGQYAYKPLFRQGDIRNFNTGQCYDAAIMMFAVVGYLTDNKDVLSGLRNIRKHLKTGAMLVCDFWYGVSVLTERPTDRIRVIELADKQILRTASTCLDSTSHTAEVQIRVWSMAGNTIIGTTDETHRMRYFFAREFEFYLEQAGFELCQLSAFPTLDQPLDDQTWNALAVARAV